MQLAESASTLSHQDLQATNEHRICKQVLLVVVCLSFRVYLQRQSIHCRYFTVAS